MFLSGLAYSKLIILYKICPKINPPCEESVINSMFCISLKSKNPCLSIIFVEIMFVNSKGLKSSSNWLSSFLLQSTLNKSTYFFFKVKHISKFLIKEVIIFIIIFFLHLSSKNQNYFQLISYIFICTLFTIFLFLLYFHD